MEYILSSQTMREADKRTMDYYKVPSCVLMERAAMAVYEELQAAYNDADSFLIVCGNGNNGGDGLVLARLLYLSGKTVMISFVGNEDRASIECKRQLEIVRNYHIPIMNELPDNPYDVVVDSIFGIGLARDIEGHYRDIIEQMNNISGAKVAIDICSGINSDTGQIMGVAFKAELTVTMAFLKLGHLTYPGAMYSGRLVAKNIGIDTYSLGENKPDACSIEDKDCLLLPSRRPDSNKGSFGRVLVVAGSKNMAGAAYLSGKASYRMGAGLVNVFSPESNRTIIQTLLPEAVLTSYDDSEDFDEAEVKDKLSECIDKADAIVVGPGLSTCVQARTILKNTLALCGDKPCVIDADALNIIADEKINISRLTGDKPRRFILTPHMGEMSRLTGLSIKNIKADVFNVARCFAGDNGCVLVLKDANTVTASADGEVFINRSGNNGMSTGGSGDVLTGIISGILAQWEKSSKEKDSMALMVALGVYIHGKSGDEAAEVRGERAMTAVDILEAIKI